MMKRSRNVIEDIMHQDARPLLAVDIIEQLHRQFALLTGGRGKDGAPVITFPEFSGFSGLLDEDFSNVLTYLTSIPSQEAANIGFIIVIDRRRDKWGSVRSALSRITRAFPADVQLVLVLRPSRILQRAFTDIGMRMHRDDFKMKVVMLNSLSELHGYVDKPELTSELGGNLEYAHGQWIHHRTAIESFAVTVKATAQALRRLTGRLSSAELPGDVQGAESLLGVHREEHGKLNEELKLAVKQGVTLLSCIKDHAMKKPSGRPSPDVCDSLGTVERLVTQLDETGTSLQLFWSGHQQKLEQCVALRRFQQDCADVKALLHALREQQAVCADAGDSVTQVGQLLDELRSLQDKAQGPLEASRRLVLHGDQLSQSGHYAADYIGSACADLTDLSDAFEQELGGKISRLETSQQIHGHMEKVDAWCESGVYLLASQAVDKCQSQEGAEAALRDIQAFLLTADREQLGKLGDLHHQYHIQLPEQLKLKVQKALARLQEVQEMFEKRQVSLKRLSARQTRPVQPVAPHPESSPKRPSPKTPQTSLPAPAHRAADTYGLSRSPTEPELARRKNLRKSKGGIKIEVMHEASQGGLGNVLVTNESEESLLDRQRHIVNELIETERLYVGELQSIVQGYANELEKGELSHLVPAGVESNKDVLFGNLFEIYDFHKRTFRKELESCYQNPQMVGRCFLKRKEDLQMYQKYCQNKPRSEALWRQFGDAAFFQACQKKLDHRLSLDAYLLKPVQRITKYQLMLKEMLKCSKDAQDMAELEEALSTVLDIIKSVNDSMHQIAITGFEGNLKELGKLLMQGSFSVWTEHKKGHSKVKDLARFKPMQRHLFLYSNALLFCKRREEACDGPEKSISCSYRFKHSLNMSAVGITENLKGDSKKFEVWYNGREEVYIIQAPSVEVKNMWVLEIRKVLTEQLEACREALQLQRKLSDGVSHATSRAGGTRKHWDPSGADTHQIPALHTVPGRQYLPSTDTEDCDTVPSSGEELSDSSSEEMPSRKGCETQGCGTGHW